MTIDLSCYAGVIAASTALLEALKRTLPHFVKGRERPLCLGLTIVLCIVAKLTGLGFDAIDWLPLVISAVFASAASGAVHEHVVRKPKPKNGATEGPGEGTPP